MIPLILAAAVATASPSCAAQVADAKPAIDHANSDWVRALKAGDAAAIAAAYADDGVFVLQDGTAVKGRAAIEQLYARSNAARGAILGGGIETRGAACAGGLVYEWGEGRLTTRGADGAERTSGGPYLTVWKRVDGAWKIVRNLAF